VPPGPSSLRGALGLLASGLARLLLATLRVTVSLDPRLDPSDARPWVLAFWHGEQLPLLAWRRRRPTAVLVSFSADGQIQARALRALGFRVERGSSSRGAVGGLVAMVRRLEEGHDAAFAVDGPRGPRLHVAPGAQVAARRSFGVLVPMACAVDRVGVLGKTWDRYLVPYPFARVVIRLGPPLDPRATSSSDLREAIVSAGALATETLGALRSPRARAGLSASRRAER